MSFLTPLFLLLGLLAAPIIIMYMLRLRRREVMVSSTLLWRELLRDRQANAPWQRLRRNLLLILQLLILAALVLALARPFLPVPTIVSGNIVVLLDGSASMQATDVAPNRFGAAKERVADLIGNVGGGDQMTLILAGGAPTVLAPATRDRAQLRAALDEARPSNGEADWTAAVALASGAAQGFQDARIVVVSDGGLPDDLPPLPAEVVYLPVGESGQNLAITALATRDAEDGPQLFARVTNNGRLPQSALLSIRLDGTLFDSRRVDVPAGGSASATWTLPEGVVAVEADLVADDETADYLPLDNRAWAIHEGGVTNRALLVTPGNLFLEQLFAVLPGVEAFKGDPNAPPPEEPFDLTVYDSVPLPDPLPDADLLIINPVPGESAPLTVGDVFTRPVVTRLADDPLLQFVEWSNIDVFRARNVSAPWLRPLVTTDGGPLLLVGERAGNRVAVLTFALQESDLPLQIAFPILMANLTSWLSPGRAFDAPSGLLAGQPLRLTPGANVTAVRVEKPDGTVWTANIDEGDVLFTETNQLGLYQVSLRDGVGEQPGGRFAVNLFKATESAILPADSIPLGSGSDAPAGGEDVGQRELWPWLALIALLVLLLEWWVYHRGIDWQALRRRLPSRS